VSIENIKFKEKCPNVLEDIYNNFNSETITQEEDFELIDF